MAKYRVVGYEVGGADYGTFEDFPNAKIEADMLVWRLGGDYSVIEEDEDGNGLEIWSTKQGDDNEDR